MEAKIHPRRIYLLMNLVRKMTSSGSNDIVEAKAAQIVLDYIGDIVEWFIQRHDRHFNAANISKNHSSIEDLAPPFLLQSFSHDNQSPEDYERAASWFQLAAAKGNTSAQYNLGVLYNHGRGVKKDYSIAKKWYEKAVEKRCERTV